jgi:type IV pilus assembly protein PilQ
MMKRDSAAVETGGRMRRSRINLGAVAFVALFAAAACSSSRSSQTARDDVAPAPAAAPAPTGAETALIESAAFGQDADGARIVLNSDSPILYTSYEPKPDTLVLELPGVKTSDSLTLPSVSGDLVSAMSVEPGAELGRVQTRIVIKHRPGLKYEVSSQGKSLAIGFESPAVAEVHPEPVPAAVAENHPEPAPVVTATEIPLPASRPVPPRAGEELARQLEKVEVSGSNDAASVVLIADGALQVKDFVLVNPPRLVLDLAGVRPDTRANKIVAGAGPVVRARISQFRTRPERIARVVLDLDRARPYAIERDGERLIVRVGEATASRKPAPAAEASPSRTLVAEKPAAPEPSPTVEEPVRAAASVPAPAPREPAPAEKPIMALANPPAETSIPAERRARGVLEAKRMPRPPAAAKTDKDVLFESAEAMLAQQDTAGSRQELANTYRSKTVGGGDSQYTGEPISLDLKDADIKDVFRTISELTGLNIVIDPDVRGTVTVRLENVPWDQALELILKQNGLSYVLENNVMRIATMAKLQSEETQHAELDKARQGSTPTKTVIKKLSYAEAGATAETLKKVMSPRGDIIVDKRTNTLIIKEIPDFMPTVIQLAESLDTATPQVMIESRIVETTKTFGRNLGVNWGFNGVADAAHGNTTNLVFPNNGAVSGAVGLAAAAPNALSLRLGNVLDTFNLDIALQAAENQGLVKIISSPKVQAMTNESAFIQTGLQIPVQTVVNNTTSVIYIDATLSLNVTPQITAEGTILMDVNIMKREPAQGVQIQGGGNVPLSIRQARTKVIVKDGGTAVIGGIFQMNDNDAYNYVPGLWKIPILGNLFKNRTRSDKHDELLIFITPRIIH